MHADVKDANQVNLTPHIAEWTLCRLTRIAGECVLRRCLPSWPVVWAMMVA
jgi:hypothetical protein